MTVASDTNYKGNDPPRQQVITAGGVGSTNTAKKKNRRRNKKKVGTATNTNTESNDNKVEHQQQHHHPKEHQQQQQQHQKEQDQHQPHQNQNQQDSGGDIEKQFLEFEHSESPEEHQEKEVLVKDLHQSHHSHHSTSGGHGGGHGAGGSSTAHGDVGGSRRTELVWLFICFFGIMASFVLYGLLLEYATSGGRKLHELSFLFVTSGLYTITAAAGRYVRDETPTTIPPARFAILGLTSMGSTFCSVRSLRYVIYPIQVLAKSCKPVPVMIMGTLMGKRYPVRKYVNVVLIVLGVALFMGGGETKPKKHPPPPAVDGDESSSTNNLHSLIRYLVEDDGETDTASRMFGILLLFVSLCFDGGTGAYEDKLMSVHSVQPFDLMYNIQLGKTILAGVGLLVFNQLHIFLQMCNDMGFVLVALGLTGAMGQVFIFVTIAKFGALTCSIIGLARKVTTLVASIYFYGHSLNVTQFTGLVISVSAMVLNFMGKKKQKIEKKEKAPILTPSSEREGEGETAKMIGGGYKDEHMNIEHGYSDDGAGEIEFARKK